MRLLLFFLLLPAVFWAQNLQTDWQKTLGHSGDITIHQMVEATNGYLLAVGETRSSTQGGTDGWLLIADYSTGQVIAEKRFGGKKDDVLYAVTQTFEGNFLLAGATSSMGKGKSDAWLLLVNDRGELLHESLSGTIGRDEYRHIIQEPDGSIVLAGFNNDGESGDIWLSKMQDDSVRWQKNLGSSEFETLSGFVTASDGGFVFCGNTGKKAENGSENIYLAKADAKGNLVWKKFFGEKGWEEALGLIATRDGGFAISGLTKAKGAGDMDAWLLKANRDGTRQWDKVFGGKDADLSNTLLQTANGGFLLGGSTKSQRSGTRSSEAWLLQTTPGGDLEWEQTQGSDKDDAFVSAIMLHDGSITFTGTYEGNTAWLLRCSDPYTKNALAGIRDAVTVKASEAKIHTSDGTLTPGEQSYLSFKIANTADFDLPDVRVAVENRSDEAGVTAWNANYYGTVSKGANTEIRVPLQGNKDLNPGTQQLSITITSGTKTLQTFEQSVTLRKPKSATLLIADYQFSPSGRSDEVTLNVQIENTGDSTSRAAEVAFVCPAGIKVKSASSAMGLVAAHSRRDARLVFEKTAQFSGSVAGFTCIVKEGGREKVRKTLDWQANSGKASLISNGPILIWSDPAPHETGTNKVRKTDDHIEVKMTVVSPKPVNTKNIKVKVNGVEMEGSKFNEAELSPPRQEDTKYIYTYRNKIPLQQGNNHLELVVDDVVSDALEVEFAPERANLFVLSIGPQHEDLQYTTKDARDFAEAFKEQGGEGKLFNEVFVTELVTPEKTDLTSIKQAIYDLAYQWDDKQIKQSDMVLVFISSHGKITGNQFKILQTGYNPKYERVTVDFKSDILEVLNNVNCKKLIFIDACHSGGAKEGYGGVSKAVVDLAKTQPGVSTLTSCGSTEKSYEDKAWGNGAFTKALLEAFQGKTCSDKTGAFNADTDGDHILRLGELYDFLRRRVPDLVQTGIPNAPTSQTPFMPENQLDKNLPLYFIEKK